VSSSSRRLRYLIFTTFIAPAVLLLGLSTYPSIKPGPLESVLLYFALVLTQCYTSAGLKAWSHKRRARALGASVIVTVRGRWIGNIDVSSSSELEAEKKTVR
jgi:hypothetical protein